MIITDQIKSQIEKIAKVYKLKLVVLFGSQATGKTHKESDVDIAVLGAEKFDMIKLMMDFDEVFKRDDVEVVDIDPNFASPALMQTIIRDGKLIYEKEEGIFLFWKVDASVIWWEAEDWLRGLVQDGLIQRTKASGT